MGEYPRVSSAEDYVLTPTELTSQLAIWESRLDGADAVIDSTRHVMTSSIQPIGIYFVFVILEFVNVIN